MAIYSITFDRAALKETGRLPADIQRAVFDCLDELKSDPRGQGVRKMAGMSNGFRVKVRGVYRIVFILDDQRHCLHVVRVRHRREAYRGL